MPDNRVEVAWSRIEERLAVLAPGYLERLNPAAEEAVLRRAEQETGSPLPPALAAWWRSADGVAPARPGAPGARMRLLPGHCDPYAVAEALDRRGLHLASQDSTVPPPLADAMNEWLDRCAQDPAGTCYPTEATALWLPQWLPVAGDGSGGGLFVDLRAGELHGCVTRFTTTGHGPEPGWPGVGALLDEVARALEEQEDPAGE